MADDTKSMESRSRRANNLCRARALELRRDRERRDPCRAGHGLS